MSDQEQKQQNTNPPQPSVENKKKETELSEEELKKISGGDAASPRLHN
jgi:bacteriocin-like protein